MRVLSGEPEREKLPISVRIFSAHAVADTRNGEDGNSDLFYGRFNLPYFSIEFTNKADGMLKFKRFDGHGGANGALGGVAKFNG